MNKRNVNRLMHTLLPFLVMVTSQRLFLLLLTALHLPLRAAEQIAFLLAAAAAFLLFRLRTYPADGEEDDAVPPIRKETVLCSALLTAGVTAGMVILMYGMQSAAAEAVSAQESVSVLRLFSLLLLHPFVEEYLFRGLFYAELRQMHPIFGCMAQAVMFALIHSTVDGMIYALTAGILLGILYEYTGRLGTVILTHSLVNLRSYLCVTVLAPYRTLTHGADAVLLCLGLAAFCVFYALDFRRRKKEKEEAAENRPDTEADA